jgi:flagellar biosynthesis chaperone FliJ
MLMMKSKRFEPIHEIASTSAKDLSRRWARPARKVADLERQLEQLQTYRDEYVRNSTQSGGAMDAVKLQNYRIVPRSSGRGLRQHEKNLDQRARRIREAANALERKAHRGRVAGPGGGSLSQGKNNAARDRR